MIIIKFTGGLGNQMFQYACGRAVGMWRGETPVFDLSFYNKSLDRKFWLADFNIIGWPASQKELAVFNSLFSKIIRATGLNSKNIVIDDKNFDAGQIASLAVKNICLNGYFPDQKYFLAIAEKLRGELTLKQPLGETASAAAKAIKSAYLPVSLHIRRGDYITNQKVSEVHGTLDISYYEEASRRIAALANSPTFFIFSDDIEWAKKNLRLPCPVEFISRPEITVPEELMLMSACRHHIIANSTFSWWAAWLNQNSDKIVVAPRHWFKDGSRQNNPNLPKWIQI